MRLTFLRSVLVLSMLGVGSTAVHAVDGVIEINQTLALAGDVSPGDTPGFPVNINRSGSYRLTSNLDVSDAANPANTTAIFISVDDVSVDLNGFTIQGPSVCAGNPPGQPPGCTPTGSGQGVETLRSGIRISNGGVAGVAGTGIFCNQGCIVERVTVRSNGGNGIRVGDNSQIRECHAERNNNSGLVGPPNVSGFLNGVIVERSTALRNGANGIHTFGQGLVLNNVASGNFSFGLRADSVGGASAAFVGNVFSQNGASPATNQTLGGTQIGGNYCGNNATCP